MARGRRVPPCRSYSFARGQCWEAKAPSCFDRVSPEQSAGQERSSKPQPLSQFAKPCCKSHRLGNGHSKGTRLLPTALKPPNQKSASAPKAGRCAGRAPEQGVSWLFSVLVPKHRSCGARRLLFDFLSPKEDGRAQAPRAPSQPARAALGVTPGYLFPSLSTKIRDSLLCLCHFCIPPAFFLEWLAGAVLARGWHRLLTRGSARARVRTMLHLVQEGYCRHFYNIYNCT